MELDPSLMLMARPFAILGAGIFKQRFVGMRVLGVEFNTELAPTGILYQ